MIIGVGSEWREQLTNNFYWTLNEVACWFSLHDTAKENRTCKTSLK